MKYEIYKAVDVIDGELSLFAFDEIDGFTVIDYSDEGLARMAHFMACLSATM